MVLWVKLTSGLGSYLYGRQQSVKLGGSRSNWGSVYIGVPQGSIIGLLLFSIFLNDLPTVVEHAEVNMYADEQSCSVVVTTYKLLIVIFSSQILIEYIVGYKQIGYS